MKKALSILTIIFFAVYFTNCKKSSALKPVNSDVSDYDSVNNIFRVKASAANVNYTVSVITKSASSGTQISEENGIQGPGTAFEYPFTPAIGDSIKIAVQSSSGTVYLYPLYKGILLTGVTTQNQSGGGTIANFNYLVTK